MKKVFYRNKNFKIIPEAKIVQGVMNEKWVDVDTKSGIKPIYKFIIELLASKLDNTDNDVWATAYCDENDEFNEKVGIEVCSAKMKMKNHLRLAKLYDRMYKILTETSMIVARWRMKHINKAQSINDDLERTWGRGKV